MRTRLIRALGIVSIAGGALAFAVPSTALAEAKHGLSAFGDLAYPADFHHFNYANPDAPKGGTFSLVGWGGVTTFDSLNNYILKGDAAQGLGKIAHSFLQSLLEERHLAFLRLIFAESRRFPALGSAWYTRGPAATCAYVAAFLGSQQARGTRLSASPEVSARLFHGMVLASVLHRALATGVRPDDAEIDALVRDAIAVIMPAIDAGTPSEARQKR